ncbi:hypothetical protein AS593_13640 [Caulobacter vibrioides]|nr:hypothetical protein AS593_13640 [Caulobacter vibrioides]
MNQSESAVDDGDLLPRIEAMMESMTRSDLKIAKLILKSPHEFVRASVRSVATDLGVSEPTVLRFCRTIGCEGFKDLKFRLIQELAHAQAVTDQRERAARPAPARAEPVAASGADAAVADRLFDTIIDALGRTRESLSEKDLQAAALAIAKAARVVVYGIGGSSAALAGEIHNRLFRLDVPAMVFTDGYAQRMSAAILSPGDVAVFLSSTGRPRELQESMELAKHYKAVCIAITDADSPLGRDADICLHVGLSPSGVEEFQPNPMRFAQLFVIDRLAYAVASSLGERAHQMLRRARGSVAWLHGIAPQQPIGD